MELPKMDPLKLSIMDVDAFVKKENLMEVTSNFVRESSSTKFHPQGLFSEQIFGEVATDIRLVRFGYINLNTRVYHPRIYKTILKLKAFYGEVISGSAYAKYDKTTQSLIKATMDDEDAGTGYSFFVKEFAKIKFKSTGSKQRDDRIEMLSRYKDRLMMTKCIVLPAGVRDLRVDETMAQAEEINKFYNSLLNYCKAIPQGMGDSPMYDVVRYSIQKKLIEIDDYIMSLLDDKTGFLQKKYAARNIALGTRNVISSAAMTGVSIEDPKFLKCGYSGLPLFQATKAFQPLMTFGFKMYYFSQLFAQGSNQVSVIDPKTYNLIYEEVDEATKDKFLSSNGIQDMINDFRDTQNRSRPVCLYTDEGKKYYTFLVYDDGDTVYHLRDVKQFENDYNVRNTGKLKFTIDRLRPITYVEMFYFVCYMVTRDKHVMITRYPVAYESSICPSKIHLLSTTPSRTVNMGVVFDDEQSLSRPQLLPEYPIVGNPYIDSTVLHPSTLAGYGADFDGDTVSVIGVMSTESNKEVDEYMNSPQSVLKTNLSFSLSFTNVVDLTLFNMTKDP